MANRIERYADDVYLAGLEQQIAAGAAHGASGGDEEPPVIDDAEHWRRIARARRTARMSAEELERADWDRANDGERFDGLG